MLMTGGKDLRLERLAEGKVLLRHTQTNDLKEVTERQLIDAIQSGQVQLQGVKTEVQTRTAAGQGDFRSEVVLARQESATALQVMLDKRRWLEALAGLGITNLVNEPWVRVAIEALASKELAGVRRFEISTLRSAARKVQRCSGDWTVLIPMNSTR